MAPLNYQDNLLCLFFKKNNVSLHYQTFGNPKNPALVFSNSLGTDYTMWQAQIDALQKDFFLICYDTREHGQSTAPNKSYTIAKLGCDVVGLLEHLHIKKPIFVVSLWGPNRYLAVYSHS